MTQPSTHGYQLPSRGGACLLCPEPAESWLADSQLCAKHAYALLGITDHAGVQMTTETHTCGCGAEIVRTSNRGPWPSRCANCKAKGITSNGMKPHTAQTRAPNEKKTGGGKRQTAVEESEGLDIWDAVDGWQLSFLEGNAVVFIYNASCEDDDDAKLEAYREARSFLDHAIKRLEAA